MALYSFLKQSGSGLMVILLFPLVSFGQPSPYAGQQSREIKALSSDEIQGYLSGSGMGFAKAAELHHYPGPKHVLELTDVLHLTERQRTQTLDLYEFMRQDAIRLGKRLVEEERRLSQARRHEPLTDHLERVRCFYNFVCPHGALQVGKMRRTPAMQAGLVTRRLRFRDIFRSAATPVIDAVNNT